MMQSVLEILWYTQQIYEQIINCIEAVVRMLILMEYGFPCAKYFGNFQNEEFRLIFPCTKKKREEEFRLASSNYSLICIST